jgi:hypothetical protein
MKEKRHRLCFGPTYGYDEMVWSQIIFDIVIIYLHRLAQLMMKQIGHKLGL